MARRAASGTTPAKLSRPRIHDAIPRQRLFDRLDVLRHHPLVWISGPPGAGKTSLVSSWLDARRAPYLWYQVDPGDSDPATLFSFLVELAQTPKRAKRALPYLTADYQHDLGAFARRFFLTLFEGLAPGTFIVFDNCQDAASDAFHDMLRHAVGQLPESIVLIVISRSRPPDAFIRHLANRTVGLLDGEALRLSEDESGALIARSGVTSDHSAPDLHRRSEGWAAGLVLLLTSIENTSRESAAIEISPPPASTEGVFTYFGGEVFAQMPPEDRDFLMRTALLPHISPQVAAQLTSRTDALDVLERLYFGNYFTLRQNEHTYRYHDLFRAFLLDRAGAAYDVPTWRAITSTAGRLLGAEGEFEHAVALFAQAGAWSEIEACIADRAEALMGQGRWATLLRWLACLPQPRHDASATLLYWKGVAISVMNIPCSRDALSRAADLFADAQDVEGEVRAVSRYVDGYWQEWHTVETMDPWLNRLLLLLETHAGSLSSDGVRAARLSLLIAMIYRRPAHPLVPELVATVTEEARHEGDPDEQLRAKVTLMHYHQLMGNFEQCRALIGRPQRLSDRRSAPRLRTWEAFRASICHGCNGDDELAIAASLDAVRCAHEEGAMISPAFHIIGYAYALLGAGRATEAWRFIEDARPLLDTQRHMEVIYFHWVELWALVLLGQFERAQCHWDAFADMPTVGVAFNTPYNHAAIFLLCLRGEFDDAVRRVARWRNLLEGMASPLIAYNLDLMESYILLRRGDAGALELILRRAFRTAARHGFRANLSWIPDMMAPLCSAALRMQIEVDFVNDLIRRRGLRSPGQDEAWPWPVKIYALGRFLVLKDGGPIKSSHRPQYRTLDFLKAIIAAGPDGAVMRELAAQLWPESDGDAGMDSLRVCIYRLRKLLGSDSAVCVEVGRVCLDRSLCWVDAHAFDDLTRVAPNDTAQVDASSWVQAVTLYSGAFLGDEAELPLALAYRDRLHAKFHRLVRFAGRRLEEANRWQDATGLYQRALEIDGLQEEIYRRLMIALRERGEFAEAMGVYRRCRELLARVLQVSPSPETQSVMQSLQQAGHDAAFR